MINDYHNPYNEVGTLHKNWGGKVPFALVYPNTYNIGMSNLAIHILYKYLNNNNQIVLERFFLDTENRSIESKRTLSDFKIIGFTFSFEADYLNIPKILGKNIPLEREERSDKHPILIAGGPAVTINPDALSAIFDVIVVGEIEDILDSIITILSKGYSKNEILEHLAQIKGLYVPQINSLETIQKIITKDLNIYPTETFIYTNNTEFGHMHLIEVARGCPWGCKFCATPSIYEPYRTRSKDSILESVKTGQRNRNHIGLIGSDVLGIPDFEEIANTILKKNLKLSFSSLRINRITKEVASILVQSGHKRATLGIEAGSERLRKFVNKSLTEDQIFQTIKNLASKGITNLKLYFMIGLPTETEDDIREISILTKEIRKIILKERRYKILSPNISIVVTPFVPKLLTSFAKENFAGKKVLAETLKLLKSMTRKIPNTTISGESPKQAELEYKLSQGTKEEILSAISST